ncbi:MAG: glutamate racemase [Candidatus Paceibacterota bacterium]
MKIGIFDSGLGGLIVAKAIHKMMPEYDYVYFGDTKRVPYGNKSHDAVYEFTKRAVDHLFRKENCAIVIIACNTASARALREIQQKYLPALNRIRRGRPKNYPDRKVLGVLIPAAETASLYQRVGVLATLGTVASNTFPIEIKKLNKKIKVFQNPAPVLVSIIEEGENKLSTPFLLKYLKPLLKKNLDSLVLGCTHYPILKKEIKKLIPKNVKIISQDEVIPRKFKEYLTRHLEITEKLSKNKSVKILVTDKTQNVTKLVKKWFGKHEVEIISDSSLSA